ncbi:MAG: hypothetical protein V6Z81_07510 [Parvularculales bacterium]
MPKNSGVLWPFLPFFLGVIVLLGTSVTASQSQELPIELPQKFPVELLPSQELPAEQPQPQELPAELPQELPVELPQEFPVELPPSQELPAEQPQPQELPTELPQELPIELPRELPTGLPQSQELQTEPPTELPQSKELPAGITAKPLETVDELNSLTWPATGRNHVIALMTLLPDEPPSPAQGRLIRRLLLSPAVTSGEEGSGEALPYLKARLRALEVMGRTQDIRESAALAGSAARQDRDIFLMVRRAALAQGDYEAACDLSGFPASSPEEESGLSESFVRMETLCLLAAGEGSEAGLVVSIAREDGFNDALFEHFVSLIADGVADEAPEIERLTPIYAALFYLGQFPLPPDIVSRTDASLLPWLMQTPLLADEGRLAAGERAVARGLVEGAALAELFAAIEFDESERNSPEEASKKLNPVMADALFYQAVQNVPDEDEERRMEMIAAAFVHAQSHKALGAVVPVYDSMLRAMSVPAAADSPLALAVSGGGPERINAMMSALLQIGAEDEARVWAGVLSGETPGGFQALALLPLAVSGGPWLHQQRETVNRVLSGGLEEDNPAAADRVVRAAIVMDALGARIKDDVWHEITVRSLAPATEPATEPVTSEPVLQPLRREPKKAPPAPLPQPSTETAHNVSFAPLLQSLRRAIQNRESGLVVLLSLLALGEQGVAQGDNFVVAEIINGLQAVGFEEEARHIALEALLGAITG